MDSEIYEVRCPAGVNPDILAHAIVPGSKSITNRALLLAAMANGASTLKGCLTSDDARHFLECLKTLGFPVTEAPDGKLGSNITITGFGGAIPTKTANIYVGSAGTAARFLVAMLAFSDGEYTVCSSEQMKKRPMQPLIDALRSAGAAVKCLEQEGHFPLQVIGIAKTQGQAAIPDSFTVNIDQSSQFLSALLIAVGALRKKAVIHVTGTHGLSYVDLTAAMMKDFGITVQKQTADEHAQSEQAQYLFSGAGAYHPREYAIEPDMSAAAYFYALAAVLGAKVTVDGVNRQMLQGDTQFLSVLQTLGCQISASPQGIIVSGPSGGRLKGGFTIDMASFSDQALTLAAIAPFADAPIAISGIGHIRLQECDRIKAIVNNLTALGIRAEEKPDGVIIFPGTPKGCQLDTYGDHRVAMSFALTGLRTPGVQILNPSCCKKTFTEYFDILEKVLTDLERKH